MSRSCESCLNTAISWIGLNSPGVCAWEISERTCVYGRSFSLPISPANMTPSALRCSTARRAWWTGRCCAFRISGVKSRCRTIPTSAAASFPTCGMTTEKWSGTPITPLPRTMPLCGMPSVSICPHSGSARRSWNGAAPSWSISVLRCAAMCQAMWSLRGRKRRRCLRRGISLSVRICCSRLSQISPIPPRTRKPGRWDCACWNPASR